MEKVVFKKVKLSNISKIIKANWGLVLVLVLSLLPLLDLLHPGLPLTHDGKDHVARIANFYLSLSEGNIVPRWAANLNWGYGHPVMMFLYPLPSYIASLFHFLGFSLIDSVKAVFAIGLIGSGVAMYLWIKNFLGEYAAVIAGILYMYAPYRFVDLYVRGAIGEHVAFIFMPLVLFFLLKLHLAITNKKKTSMHIVGIAISFAALLLSHNAISVMFLPILVGYFLYLAFINKKRKFLIWASSALFFGLLLSAFFLFPAFLEGKYTLRDIVTGNEYANRFSNPLSILYGPWSYGGTGQFSVQVGLVQLFFVLIFPYVIYKLKRNSTKHSVLYGLFGLAFLLSLLLIIKESNFIYHIITTLQKFQFPWRFLTITVLTTSVLGAFAFSLIKKKKIANILLTVFVFFILFINKDYWHARGYLYSNDTFFNSIYDGTTDTGESSPIWSIRFMEHRPKERVELIGGKATIVEKGRNTTVHTYLINTTTNIAQIKENTVYFPGWKVLVNGRQVPIQFQDKNNLGLITFNVPQGKSDVVVKFTNTKLRVISGLLSLGAFLCMIIFSIISFRLNSKAKS